MAGIALPSSLFGAHAYMVGIKGTGMAALAEILVSAGMEVEGSDTDETFYTDEILHALHVRVHEGFDARNMPAHPDVVIYSAAYDPDTHAELRIASSRGIPLRSYTQALGVLSRLMRSVGIAGSHGKTTTAALIAMIVREARLPGIVLAGSALPDLGVRSTLVQGDRFFVAETCEYRRNFLSFSPSIVVVTSVEADHLDYFADVDDVMDAFAEYAGRLSAGGELIYCADEPGAGQLAERVARERPEVRLTAYGESADGEGHIAAITPGNGTIEFSLPRGDFALHIPGRHNVLNAAAAVLVAERLRESGDRTDDASWVAMTRRAIASFHGTRRRSEIIGEPTGVLIMDDYAHHPTAIRATIAGLREFYPGRRIILDFMSHTYTRTAALLEEFARAVSGADAVILHDIYPSAREHYTGGVTGESLYAATRAHTQAVHYVPAVLDALPLAEELVQRGDIFLTMGAGNNWQLGRALAQRLERREHAS